MLQVQHEHVPYITMYLCCKPFSINHVSIIFITNIRAQSISNYDIFQHRAVFIHFVVILLGLLPQNFRNSSDENHTEVSRRPDVSKNRLTFYVKMNIKRIFRMAILTTSLLILQHFQFVTCNKNIRITETLMVKIRGNILYSYAVTGNDSFYLDYLQSIWLLEIETQCVSPMFTRVVSLNNFAIKVFF